MRRSVRAAVLALAVAAGAGAAPAGGVPVLTGVSVDRSRELVPDAAYRERERAYCLRHYGVPADTLDGPRAVVIHATHTESLSGTFASFSGPLAATRPDLAAGGDLETGSHFVIARDGRIYSYVPLPRVARHAVGYNRVAIGIELQAATNGRITGAQLEAAAGLVRALEASFPTIRYVFGHDEYDDASAPWYALMEEREAGYRPWPKTDPGRAAMVRLRALLAGRAASVP